MPRIALSLKSIFYRPIFLAVVVLFLSSVYTDAQVTHIQIISQPGAEVFFDSRERGIIPDDGILNIQGIKTGKYETTIVMGTQKMTQFIVVPDENERILYFDLSKKLSEDRSPVHRTSKNGMLQYENDRVSFGKFTDLRDGMQYSTIHIESNTWMAENLRYEVPGNSFVYPRDPIHEQVYGRLYTWEAAIHACPEGWHLPTDSEWFELEVQLGVVDTLLASRGWRKCTHNASLKSDSGWLAATPSADTLGFSAFPGGFRDHEGYFFNEGYFAYFWTATEADAADAWYRVVTNDIPDIGRFSYSKKYAFSIRCVKDPGKPNTLIMNRQKGIPSKY